MTVLPFAAALLLALALPTDRALAQQLPVDSGIARYVAAVRAIDTHAHPMRPVADGAAPDSEYDALPLDGIPAFALPHRLTREDAVWRRAASALYAVPADGAGAAYDSALAAAVARAHRELGERFPAWVLDRLGTETMLANRVAMGPGLDRPRFRWVAFVDALMLPLDTRGEATRTPDTRVLYPREASLLARYLRESSVARRPASLADYERLVVRPTLARMRAGGAVAVKFEAAYLRPLDFGDDDPARAARIYARYAHGGVPSRADYKALEDHLFHAITREAGRLGMAVQIHVLETFGGYYDAAGASPRLLGRVLDDSTLRGTRLVIVHGGWPLVGETQALLARPNVYADVSMMDVILPPSRLAEVLHGWLVEWPDKVMFGSDAFDGGALQGWEQVAWVGTTTTREALAIALTTMLRDGEIDRPRAEQLARMVLRENAIAAYGL